MLQLGTALLGFCLCSMVVAESVWLLPQPQKLQTPASVNTPHQECNYPEQLKRARLGIAENQYQVALCYYYGLGVDTDPGKAQYWLEQAALQKHPNAMFHLAEFYNRHDQYYNPALASEWYKKAAAKDHVKAQLRLAGMYVAGKGVPQDYVEAYKWFYLAGMFSASGEPRLRGSVRRQRQVLIQKMNPEQISRAREAISLMLQRLPAEE